MGRTATAVSCLFLTVAFLASPNFRWERSANSGPFGGDFLQEWIGGRIVLSGDYSSFYDVANAQRLEHDPSLVGYEWRESEYLPMVYPPFYYVLVAPLSLLPSRIGAWIWAGIMVVSYLSAWLLFATRQRREVPGAEKLSCFSWFLPVSLLFMPLIENFTSCQKGSLLLLILSGTYRLLRSGREFQAGLLFGLIAFKPQFALPIAIAMLCKRQWRFVLGGCTTGSLLVAVCLAMGLDVCRQYSEFSAQAHEYLLTAGYDLSKSHTIQGFFTLLLGNEQIAVARFFTVVASVALIFVLIKSLGGRLDPQHPRFAWQFSLLIVSTVLFSPHLYTYDLTVLLLPMGIVASRALCQYEIPSPMLRWISLATFSLLGLCPTIAAATHVQLSVLLLGGLTIALHRQIVGPTASACEVDQPIREYHLHCRAAHEGS